MDNEQALGLSTPSLRAFTDYFPSCAFRSRRRTLLCQKRSAIYLGAMTSQQSSSAVSYLPTWSILVRSGRSTKMSERYAEATQLLPVLKLPLCPGILERNHPSCWNQRGQYITNSYGNGLSEFVVAGPSAHGNTADIRSLIYRCSR